MSLPSHQTEVVESEPQNTQWANDLLDRRLEAQTLRRFLLRRYEERRDIGEGGAYVLNIDSRWGTGKTYFISNFRGELETSGFLTAHIDAWLDDASGSPLVTVMEAIESAIAKRFPSESRARKSWQRAKVAGAKIIATTAIGAAKTLASKFVGSEVDALGDAIKELVGVSPSTHELEGGIDKVTEEAAEGLTKWVDSEIKRQKERLKSISNFKTNVSQALEFAFLDQKINAPMFVFIDELDRCRPTYAIELLEQVKHIFDVSQIVFIISTDSIQLSHSIRAIYGSDFDSKSYLRRFFSRRYSLAEPSLEKYVAYLIDRYSIDVNVLSCPLDMDVTSFLVGAFRAYNLDLRSTGQCFDMLRTFVSTWNYPVKIQLIVLIPLIIMSHKHDEAGVKNLFGGAPLGVRAPGWGVERAINHGYGQGVSSQWIDMGAVAQSFMSMSNNSLPDIGNRNSGSDPVEIWNKSQFQNEFSIMHRNAYNGEGPKSIIRDYAKVLDGLTGYSEQDEG